MEPMGNRSAADELAEAEAQLKAAQQRVDAARQRAAAEQGVQGAQGSPAAGPVQAAGQAAQPWGQPGVDPGTPYGQPQGGYQAPAGQPYTQQPFEQPTYGAAPQNPYGQPGQQYAAPIVGEKDHVAAGLLALFLGWLGVHKFYLGYNTAGFIMLGVSILGGILTLSVASWAIWVIAIVEGIFYLTKSQVEFEQMYVLNKREWF